MQADTTIQLTPVDGTPFVFSRFEIPQQIAFGGKQRLAVHELVGGIRVVDAMGRSDDSLSWSGLFQGSTEFQATSLARARYLDGLRISGKKCKLTFSELSYTVVVAEFSADFQRFYQIPYRITLTVVSDDANPVTTAAKPGVDELIDKDVNDANTVGGKYANLKASVAKVKSTWKTIKSKAQATAKQINDFKNDIESARKAVANEIASVSNTAKQITTLGGLLPNNGVARFAQKATGQANATMQNAELHNLQYTLGRLSKNVSK